MKNQDRPNKVDLGGYVMTEEEKNKLRNHPDQLEWRALCAKIDDGTATPEEIKKYNYELEPIRESMLNPNLIWGDMPHAEVDVIMREKRRKRLEAEAKEQNPEQ